MKTLVGRVAVVTGASRGLGKGIALGLGEAGATVYATGRSTGESSGNLPGTIEETAAEVTALGGQGIAVRCDHRVDVDVEALFERVWADHGRLDLLVNNAMGSPDQQVLWSGLPFWEIPVELWDGLIDVGLRSHFVASRCAAPLMIEQGHGVIINVASHGAGKGKSRAGSDVIIPYSVAKAGLHRLGSDMAVDLRGHGVTVIEIWPPASTTEGVLARADFFGDLRGWRPPLFTGRVVAALASEPDLLARTGKVLVINDLATELGISQVN